MTLCSLYLFYPVQPHIVIKTLLPFLCSPTETTPVLSVDIAETIAETNIAETKPRCNCRKAKQPRAQGRNCLSTTCSNKTSITGCGLETNILISSSSRKNELSASFIFLTTISMQFLHQFSDAGKLPLQFSYYELTVNLISDMRHKNAPRNIREISNIHSYNIRSFASNNFYTLSSRQSSFASVILRPSAVVQPRFEPTTSHKEVKNQHLTEFVENNCK